MRQVKVMPKGYSPLAADAVCTDWHRNLGVSWTPEDSKRSQEMYDNAPVLTVDDDWKPPIGQWHEFLS